MNQTDNSISDSSYFLHKLESNVFLYKRILIILGIASLGLLIRNYLVFYHVYPIARFYFYIYVISTLLIPATRILLPILYRNKRYLFSNLMILVSCAILFYSLVLMSVLDSISIKDYKYVNDYNFTAYIFGLILVGFTLRIDWKISAGIFSGGIALFTSLYYRYTPTEINLQSILPLLIINILAVYFSYSREKFYLILFRDSSRYRNQSIKDSLTQTYNRRHLSRLLSDCFILKKSQGKPFSCIFADIDHFKSINDRYGHEAGDRVLQQFADVLLHECRSSDSIVRYGGEEFLMVLGNTRASEAGTIAERIRSHVETMEMNGISPGITCSFGITEAGEDDSEDSLIKRADMLLYQAKEEGRNRCCRG